MLEQCPNTKLVVNVSSQSANLQQLINGLSIAFMKAGLLFSKVPFAVQYSLSQQKLYLDPTAEEQGPSITYVFVREPSRHVIQGGAIRTTEKGFRQFTEIMEMWQARTTAVDDAAT